jgi:hypothetical protein
MGVLKTTGRLCAGQAAMSIGYDEEEWALGVAHEIVRVVSVEFSGATIVLQLDSSHLGARNTT